MMYIIIIIIILFIIYDRSTRSFINPYKLIMIFGKKGSGKTTYLTKVAINEIKKGKKVYSTIYIPGTYQFNVDDLGKSVFPQNSVIVIDEVGMIWDNRDFKNFKPYVRDYFKYQRQYKNKVYLFSQTFDIDLKLRNLTDEMYLLRSFARVFSIARKINKNITIQRAEEGSGKASTLVDNYEFAPILSHNAIIFTFIPRWIPFFKSYDPPQIKLIGFQYNDFSKDQLKYLDFKKLVFSYVLNVLKKYMNLVKEKFTVSQRSENKE